MYELSYMEIRGEPGNSPGIRSILLRQLGIFAGFFQGFQVMEIQRARNGWNFQDPGCFRRCLGPFPRVHLKYECFRK